MIIYSLGLLFCLGLLFYFIAKYKENDVQEDDFPWEEIDSQEDNYKDDESMNVIEEEKPAQDFFENAKEEANAVQQVQKLFTKTETFPAREFFDIKDKVKDFSYTLEENRLLEEKHYNELKILSENLEKRLSSFENEYMNNLYPILTNLIKELENIQNKTSNN